MSLRAQSGFRVVSFGKTPLDRMESGLGGRDEPCV